jgi:hypothetical protein
LTQNEKLLRKEENEKNAMKQKLKRDEKEKEDLIEALRHAENETKLLTETLSKERTESRKFENIGGARRKEPGQEKSKNLRSDLAKLEEDKRVLLTKLKNFKAESKQKIDALKCSFQADKEKFSENNEILVQKIAQQSKVNNLLSVLWGVFSCQGES